MRALPLPQPRPPGTGAAELHLVHPCTACTSNSSFHFDLNLPLPFCYVGLAVAPRACPRALFLVRHAQWCGGGDHGADPAVAPDKGAELVRGHGVVEQAHEQQHDLYSGQAPQRERADPAGAGEVQRDRCRHQRNAVHVKDIPWVGKEHEPKMPDLCSRGGIAEGVCGVNMRHV